MALSTCAVKPYFSQMSSISQSPRIFAVVATEPYASQLLNRKLASKENRMINAGGLSVGCGRAVALCMQMGTEGTQCGSEKKRRTRTTWLEWGAVCCLSTHLEKWKCGIHMRLVSSTLQFITIPTTRMTCRRPADDKLAW